MITAPNSNQISTSSLSNRVSAVTVSTPPSAVATMLRSRFAPRSQWSSLLSYLLVTTGMVVGLGNIFKFPYFVAKYGSLFIICYISFELLISIPIFLAEALIGRHGKQNPVGAISIISMEMGVSRYWRLMGWLCFAILFLTLSYYSVEASVPLSYFANEVVNVIDAVHANLGVVANASMATTTTTTAAAAAVPVVERITPTLETGVQIIHVAFLLVFLGATFIVIARGINRGLEGISRFIVPLFFIVFLGLAGYACYMGNFKAAVNYLYNFDIHQLSFGMLFIAFTYAFFKLNVGMGTMIVYGSYLPLTAKLGRSTLLVALLDAVASLFAYFVIYPTMLIGTSTTSTTAVSTFTSLSYQVMPDIFARLPGSSVVVMLFFLATTLAAWMPTIAIAEGVTAIVTERLRVTRCKAALLLGLLVFGVALTFMLSYGRWSHVIIIGKWTLKNVIQDFSDDVLTPLSALLITIFVGWKMRCEVLQGELGFRKGLFRVWYALIRYVAPLLCGVLLMANVSKVFF